MSPKYQDYLAASVLNEGIIVSQTGRNGHHQ